VCRFGTSGLELFERSIQDVERHGQPDAVVGQPQRLAAEGLFFGARERLVEIWAH